MNSRWFYYNKYQEGGVDESLGLVEGGFFDEKEAW